MLQRIRLLHTESFQLAAGFAALFLALTGVLLVAVYLIVGSAQRAALVAAIDADIQTVVNGFNDEGVPEAIEVVRQRLGSNGTPPRAAPDVYVLLADRSLGLLAGNLPLFPPLMGLKRLPGLVPLPGRVPPPDGRVLGRGVFIADGVYLYVGRDTQQLIAVQKDIESAFIWVVVAAVLMAATGGVFFSLRLMRRIDAITHTCHAINAGRFDDRVPLRGSGDELDRLAGVINAMLDRIGGLMENLRQVSSDVAHDLRTPLTHLRNRLEESRRKSRSVEDYSAAVSHAIADTDQLLAVFSALLRISQIESRSRLASFSDVSLTEIVDRSCQMYVPVAEDAGSTLVSELVAGVHVRGDAELLTQLFSNLIENAIRHTPAGTRIVVTVGIEGGGAAASVCDDGPGIPADERPKALRRFYRLAASSSTPGDGLGLALVSAIAALHAANLELIDQGPGLCVRLRF